MRAIDHWPMQDPIVRLRARNMPTEPTVIPSSKHTRQPDVGLHILIIIPSRKPDGEDTICAGEYLSHGGSKTVFVLHSRKDDWLDGKIFKLSTKINDEEPRVFKEIADRRLTPRILYHARAVDEKSGKRFECWITERAIPLDDICKCENTIKSRCSLAAFRCILQAAQYGLYLSDCGFPNFGVQLDDSAEEHTVLIIDAGSRKIDSELQWTKGKVNDTFMHKFWKACAAEKAPCDSSSTMRVTDEAACSCDSSSVCAQCF